MKMLLILAAFFVAAMLAFVVFAKDKRNSFSKDIQYGPFTVRVTAKTGKLRNMDFKSYTYTNVAYSILYGGKPIRMPGALQNNTTLPFMWAVYTLPGAPDPTLVAGSQSLYMIYIKNGAPVVEPLVQQGSDFASLQFLDSESGQPGEFTEVFAKNTMDNLDQLDVLQGGRFLMVYEHAVLDVQTRKIWPMNPSNESMDNYAYPSPHGAIALSPDRKSIVFRGNFQSWNTANENLPDSEHALVVWNYEQARGYAVRFDDTAARINAPMQNFGIQWFNTYFEWKPSPQGDHLHRRHFDKLPNWTGRFESRDAYYYLYPVKPSLMPIFLDFVLKHMGWTHTNILKDETSEYSGRVVTVGSGNVTLDVVFREDEREIHLSNHLYDDLTPEHRALVEKLGGAFDAELVTGHYQEHFGRVINETKRIQGMDY